MKSNNLLVAILIVTSICMSLFMCWGDLDDDYVEVKENIYEDSVDVLNNKINTLEKRGNALHDSVYFYKDKSEEIKIKRDTLIIEVDNKIKEADTFTEEEANNKLIADYDNYVNILKETMRYDSLKIEYRSLTEFFSNEQNQSRIKSSIISNQEFEIKQHKKIEEVKDNIINLKDGKIKNEKKKGKKLFIAGIGVGISAAAILILLKK